MKSSREILLPIEELDRPSPDQCCRRLEEGRILYFRETPLDFPAGDRQFLMRQRQSEAHYHKNIAYRPQRDRVTGGARMGAEEALRLLEVLRSYSKRVTAFLSGFLAPYASTWSLDYASFRPYQEQGRELRTRARNDLLHVDSFPTRPTNGNRILRFFTNINPAEPRRWITTEPFETLVRQFAGTSLPYPGTMSGWGKVLYLAGKAGSRIGLPVRARSPYDEFMLRLHHAMKENSDFQAHCPKIELEFAPGSSWMVFTDLVPHAAVFGQYALEQTFMISRHSLQAPDRSPLRVLERLSGQAPLNDPGNP